MAIVVPIPQEFELQLRNEWPELERHALEGLVAEAYRDGKLSSHEVGKILGFDSRWDAIRFLEERIAYPAYGPDDLAMDRETLASLGGSSAASNGA